MSEQCKTAKIIAITKQIEIRSTVTGGLNTKVREKAAIISKGQKEIERLEVNKPSVVTKEGVTIRALERPKEIVRMVNYGPTGPRGDQGAPGEKGEPGSIENFVMDDLETIFRSRLTYE